MGGSRILRSHPTNQGHVKNPEGGRSYFWLGSSFTNLYQGFDCDSLVATSVALASWLPYVSPLTLLTRY